MDLIETDPLQPVKEATRVRGIFWLLGIIVLSFFLSPAPGAYADWRPLTARLAADGFDGEMLQLLFSRPEVKFEPKVMAGKISALVGRREDAPHVSGPQPHNKVYRGYLNFRAIAKARSFLREHRAVLNRASASYSVPPEIIVSILLVETRLGKSLGRNIVFNKLASMAFSSDLDTIRPYLNGTITPANETNARTWYRKKADWAYNELKALLDFAAINSTDPLSIRGSIYGAIGLCQFMPSNIFSYGVDADKNGRIDPFVTPDAVHSIANYLNKHGWSSGIAGGRKRKVIFDYNNSTTYVNTILAVADKIGGGRGRKR